jgi:hypothetical protein
MCWLRESLVLILEHLDWQLTLPRSLAFHTQLPPAKDVSRDLSNPFATLVNACHSRVWHGSTLLGSFARNENEQLLLVLDIHLGVLRRPLLREDLNPASVPPGLRPKEFSSCLLRLDRLGHGLQFVGDLQRNLHVHSRQPFLGEHCSRRMHEQTGRLVFCSRRERSYRLCHGHPSVATGQHSSHLQTAENSLDDRFWLWILVSCTSPFTLRSKLTHNSTCIVSVLRLVWIYPISITKDVTYESPLSALWSNVELNVGILCSCVPTLRSCMTRLFPSFFPSNTTDVSVPSQYKPNASHNESKRLTIQEIALPRDLEDQRGTNDNDPHKRPFDFIGCTNHESSEAVHLAPLRSPPSIALPKLHARKASLPDRIATWRKSQLQTAAASSSTTKTTQLPASQQLSQPYPLKNDSMKNLLCHDEDNETILASPERCRDGC